jgi:hypothetical protein
VVKIGDYGLSKMISAEQASHHSESIGTCHYMAPEISTGKYNKPIDIYAIGVILFEMITGHVPFEGETVGEVLIKHLTTRPDLSKLAEPFKSIIGQALSKDPAHRQTRVFDLLPADDAPRPRDVRFIGEGKVASPAPPPRPKPADDDILRITDEEPIHYIGPDTKPPRARVASYNPWGRRPPQPQPKPNPARRPAPAPNRMAQRVRLIATSPLLPPEPPPTPQPLPSGRVRLAELAGSMLWATPWAALGSLLIGALTHVDLAQRPQDLGYLFVVTLLGSWTVLAANKAAEGRPADPSARWLIQLVLGVLIGLAGQFLASWMMVDPSGPAEASYRFVFFNQSYAPRSLPGLLGYATYFGLVGLAVDWWTMTERARKSRFRVLPIFKAGLLALIPSVLFFQPETHPFALPAVILTAAVVQLASPWSEAAARYATYARANKIKTPPKVA